MKEGKKILGRSEILEAQDMSFKTVDVPEWGGAVRLRTMTGRERHAFQGMISRLKNTEEIVEYLLATSIVDDDGKPVFSYDDIKALSEKSARALNRIFAAAISLNGMTKEEVDNAVGE